MESYKTKDGAHGVQIFNNDGYYLAFAVQADGSNGFEYWYTIGNGYKTAQGAIKAAKKSLAKLNYELVA